MARHSLKEKSVNKDSAGLKAGILCKEESFIHFTRSSEAADPAVLAQVDSIIEAINEAKEIHSGRKEGTTFDDFLSDF